KKIYRTFIISTSLVIALVLSGIFLDMAVRTRQLINDAKLIQARIVFNTIVLTRKWNAHYGGVYVEKRAGVESNPYLEHPDVRALDGRMFTLKNPALMTRELSEQAQNDGLFKFHITSLKLMNPHNKPDAFEEKALRQFERGKAGEVFRTELINNRTYFRYMAPLLVDNACLQCHSHQNYSIGDVRGGISITLDAEDLQEKLRFNTASIIFFGVIATVLLLGLIYYFTAKLIKRLADARMQIERIAITDELTGLFNRRHLLSRFMQEFEQGKRLNTNLSCIIVDIDHFKSINDHYGHLTGDEVLKEIARQFRNVVRAYDIVGRYGGEEFLIILPDSNLEQTWNFAERTRMKIKENSIGGVQVTISLGVTFLQESDSSIDDMIKRADDALYMAKNAGRDRVEWMPRS
ncbi:MAG: diguanylate cyclase, partial [Betaproteobacteria bacterium]